MAKNFSYSNITPHETDQVRPLIPVDSAQNSTKHFQKITGVMMTELLEMSEEIQTILQKSNTPEGYKELVELPSTRRFTLVSIGRGEVQLTESRQSPVIFAISLQNGKYAFIPSLEVNYKAKFSIALQHFGVDPKHLEGREGQVKVKRIQKPAFGDIHEGQLSIASEGRIQL